MAALHTRHEEASPLGGLGSWQTVVGVAVVGGFVAIPTGLPLSEVLTRWVPTLYAAGGGVGLALLVTAAIWLGMVVWLLQGIYAYLAQARGATAPVVTAQRTTRSRRTIRVALPLAAAR